ncbi:metallophosphoesterase [Clostridium omnivorum]|uniref:Phosphoesterase n=1 Tax=Clostridium omnivorum TaxID=1604902 RepID=A0ABQ5N8H3_9CLOT|nr:metallophosphoesterase [Clostridium sp. E14]GLC31441.1 phosphoesterase [Clostridium sp. E14]
MKIGVMSDTHRHYSSINEGIKLLGDIDELIHLGDNTDDVEVIRRSFTGKIYNVKGNCDFSSSIPSERIEIIEGKKFFITHGHRYDVKYDLLNLRYRAEELGADVALFGHTHQSYISYEQGIWIVNPGSVSLPRDNVKSIAVIEITDEGINPYLRCIK